MDFDSDYGEVPIESDPEQPSLPDKRRTWNELPPTGDSTEYISEDRDR
jgi:hypothetical protein